MWKRKIKNKNLIYFLFQSSQLPFFPPPQNRIVFFSWYLLFIHRWLLWFSLSDDIPWKAHVRLRDFRKYCWCEGQALHMKSPRLYTEMLWAELPGVMITYRKQHEVLPHLHHARFWLFHILIIAHHHCAWDKRLLYCVFKNRSVEGVSPSLGPTFSSTLRSKKFFWGLKLFCSDHQDDLYSTITIMFPWFESQVLLTSRIRNQIPLPCLTLSYRMVAAYPLKNSSLV